MRNLFITAILAALTLEFSGVSPSEATAGPRDRVRSYRTRNRKVYHSWSNVSSSANRNGKKARNARRARSSGRKRVYKTYSYRIIPGSSSGSFGGGPSSLGSGKPSTSEFLVWPNGL
jgi:hypothetical protein